MATDIYSLIGFVGTACIIAAYAYLTLSDAPNPWVLHGTNLAGAALLTISLLVHTNWPSLVLEGFWALIAITGLVKAARAKPTPNPSRLREGSEACQAAGAASRSGVGTSTADEGRGRDMAT